jgi:hypothetical protein
MQTRSSCFQLGWSFGKHSRRRPSSPALLCSCVLFTHPILKAHSGIIRSNAEVRLEGGKANWLPGAIKTRSIQTKASEGQCQD